MNFLKRLLAMKVETLPTIKEACLWSSFRLGGGPMNREAYASHAKHCDKEGADRMLVLKARTATGWFAVDCFRWLTFWNLARFEECKAMSDAWADA